MPSNPSEPMLATTQHISHCNPGKATFKLIHPITVKGDESADTNFSCFHCIFKITKYSIYFVITIPPPCGHVDDSIKTTRFIEYMLTYVVCKMVYKQHNQT